MGLEDRNTKPANHAVDQVCRWTDMNDNVARSVRQSVRKVWRNIYELKSIA